MEAEKCGLVGPNLSRSPAGARREVLETLHGIFVRVFRVDALALREVEALSKNVDDLVGKALKVYLDPPLARIVERPVSKTIRVEVATEVLVDPGEEVEAEGGGHAAGVIIGGDQNVEALLEVDANQKSAALSQELRRVLQKRVSLLVGEVADGRTGEKAQRPVSLDAIEIAGLGKVADDGADG